MQLGIYHGDIITVPAEVVCVSTNPQLELVAGTGGAVREEGGWLIQRECQEYVQEHYKISGKRYVEPGSVVRTRAGTLPFRAIIHCVAIDNFHRSASSVIHNCTREALKLASRMQPPVRSIAFPVFGSGNGGFDFETALRAILEELWRNKLTIKTVYIVTLDDEQAEMARGMLNNTTLFR